MHVGDDSRRKAEEAEDDVLDARVEVRLAARPPFDGLLADQVQHDREVVRAERPERVLVRPDLAEVLAVSVQVENVAELSGVDHLLQLGHGGVVEQEVAGHEHEPSLLGERIELLGLGRALGLRLLDEDVLAGAQGLSGEVVVRDDRGRDDDRVQLRVGQELVEVARRPRLWMAPRGLLEQVRGEVAEPAQVGELLEVPGEVRAPVAEARLADA